jgi:hypothetical protein
MEPLLTPRYKFIVTEAYKERLNVENKEEQTLLLYVSRSTIHKRCSGGAGL